MYDNGLLKYYKEHQFEEGFLNADEVDELQRVDTSVTSTRRITIDKKPYFIKFHNHKCELYKPQADAEILLSQLYTKAGLHSAIYLPAESRGKKFLISNDVSNSNVMLAGNYLSSLYGSGRKLVTPFLSQQFSVANPQGIYTMDAMEQQTKLRILDTASFNTDRHLANFFYVLQRDVQTEEKSDMSLKDRVLTHFRNLKPNLVEGVSAIDFESSGNISFLMNGGEGQEDKFYSYYNDFKRAPMTRPEILEEFRNNEPLANLIDKNEFAETLGSLDPIGVSEEIKETTGYELDNKFVEFLEKSFDEVAESLVQ